MQVNKSLEQHIAVFGESGSGKTVLLSSFYGPTQEPGFPEANLYEVVAENFTQGGHLHRNYLGMRKEARVPLQNRFASHSYAFNVTPKASAGAKPPVESLKLVWHDYPGEWFEEEPEGEEEAQRRVDTFRTLLSSDVAFLLVDGERLRDNAGEEERYLKSLFTNYHRGLAGLKDSILVDGKPLEKFPRIWIIALSKADIVPDLDVYEFRNLIVDKALDEVERLHDTIRGMIQGEAALSVGEDFVRFSSAKFSPGEIDLSERIGLDLVLPLAAILPFERHAKWVEQKSLHKIPDKVIDELIDGAGALAALLVGKRLPLPGPLALLGGLIAAIFASGLVDGLLGMAKDAIQDAKQQAIAKKQFFTAVLAEFRLAMIKGEEERVLLRSRR